MVTKILNNVLSIEYSFGLASFGLDLKCGDSVDFWILWDILIFANWKVWCELCGIVKTSGIEKFILEIESTDQYVQIHFWVFSWAPAFHFCFRSKRYYHSVLWSVKRTERILVIEMYTVVITIAIIAIES